MRSKIFKIEMLPAVYDAETGRLLGTGVRGESPESFAREIARKVESAGYTAEIDGAEVIVAKKGDDRATDEEPRKGAAHRVGNGGGGKHFN